MKNLIPLLIVALLLIPIGSATSHYTFEHAEEMRVSGRIAGIIASLCCIRVNDS